MITKFETGTYIKAYGADWGLYFDGKKWISFQCLGCATAKGLVIPSKRLSNGSHPKLMKRLGWDFAEKHNKEIHNTWIQNGKQHA